MPPTNQRRNYAYLNPLIKRPAISMGLAIDLGGSLKQCFRPVDWPARSVRHRDDWAPRIRREESWDALSELHKDLCALTVELSGARAGV